MIHRKMKGDDIANEYVEAAIEECDALGREVFAKTYGFGPSKKFPLIYDGREYDSKAIVGRAYALAHPEEKLGAWTTGLQGGLRPGNAGYLLQTKGYEIDDRSNPGGPNAWMIRAGEHGEGEALALAESRTIIGWSDLGPLTPALTRQQLKEQIQNTYGEYRSASLAQQAGVLYRFIHDVEVGDLVVIPLQTNPGYVAVGWITGDYEHMPDPMFAAADAVNTRTVEWLSQAAPVSAFATDIRTAFGLQGTLKRISVPNVVDRMVNSLGSAPVPIHLIVKWSAAHGRDTVDKHMAVASMHGSVWWGLHGTPDRPKIGPESLARIRAQLAAGQDTRVFLSGPSYWRTTLSGIAVERAEVDEDLIPDYYPTGQQYGLWVRISDFEEIDRAWLTGHLELAKAPGKLLADKSLSQTTNPLIVVESAGSNSASDMGKASATGVTFDLAAIRMRAKDAGLELSDDVLAEVLAALESGKHIILTGPPGTAKTTLAQLVAEAARVGGRCTGWIPTTATADWTTYDTIGGLRPKSNQTLEFKAGHFLSALERNQWLVIDELNRSNFDRAFGQFFTVLSGQTVVLPHERVSGRGPIALVPAGTAPPAERVDVVAVPAEWRIIATMNVFDKTLLFEMSYALMRRFAFIEVPSPSDGRFAMLIDRWADGDEEAASVAKALLCVRKIDAKDIGPASYRDIVRYAHQRLLLGVQTRERMTFDAFYSFLLPQFEGIDDRQGRELCRALRSLIAPTDRPRLVSTLNTVLGLELSNGEKSKTGSPDEDESMEALDDLLDGDDPLADLGLE
jgi:MoxR-like ATPase